MEPWVAWIILAVLFSVGEILTLGFFLAPFAGGALAAAAADLAGAGVGLEIGVFIAVSVLLLALVRPIARSHRRLPPALRTGTDALIGRYGVAVERIASDRDAGRVKIEGDVWTARAFDEDEVIEPGTKVQIVAIRGATALVTNGEA